MPLYLLDANVLITADAQYYPFGGVPQFWEWLLSQAEAGVVRMVREIFEEVASGKGDMPKWLRESHVSDQIILREAVDGSLVRRVLSEGYGPELTDVELARCGRDPFLIAAGLRSRDRVVVTKEASKPTAQRANRKVPDVCQTLGVTWLDDFEMLRRLKFSTR